MGDACVVCVERHTPLGSFTCPFCEFVCCKACVKRYCLESADDPNCMQCHRPLDRELLARNISFAFVDGPLRQHRERVLMEREIAMMPATQPYVQQELQRRKNVRLLDDIRSERASLKRRIAELDRTANAISGQIVPPLESRRDFVHRCAQQGCKGFLSSAWKCNVCDRYTCSECNAPRGTAKEDGHVCDEGDRQNMQLLKRDCKRCPGCAEYIYKISGCDQMWCVSCHTAFSWRTGLKVNGVVHNPHFYEFQRTQGTLHRAQGDVVCGGNPSQRELLARLRFLKEASKISEADERYLRSMHRLLLHLEHEELPRFHTTEVTEARNLDLRVSYTLGEMDDDTFRRKLQQREKQHLKKRDISMILQMCVDSMGDMYRQFILQDNVDTTTELIRALVVYVNRSLEGVSRKFKCVAPFVCTTTWQVRSVKS